MELPEKKLPKSLRALHEHFLLIGETKLPCAVLEGGVTVLSKSAVFRAFGRTKRGRKIGEIREPNMPSFADAKNLKPFIDKELPMGLNPIAYLSKSGRIIQAYDADVLPSLCEAYLKARETPGILTPSQLKNAKVAESLMRIFAKVGIKAWIHEVTGYQYVRDANALSVMVGLYIEEERRKWQKEFRDEFYVHLFRLYGHTANNRRDRPKFFAKFTNKYIYGPMEHGQVLKELDRLNPVLANGTRKSRLHQHLTQDYGVKRLRERIEGVITCLKLSNDNKRKFESLYAIAFPDEKGHQEDLFDNEET
jgi:hypothetical protein